MLNGAKEFCQEFMTDLHLPDSDRVGEVDGGWTVGTRWMFHEKSIGISRHFIRPKGSGRGGQPALSGVQLAKKAGRLDDPVTRQLVGEAHALQLVNSEAMAGSHRPSAQKKFSDQAAGISRVLAGVIAPGEHDQLQDRRIQRGRPGTRTSRCLAISASAS